MRIAIPTSDGRLCAHFGHCAEFTVIEVDDDTRAIKQTECLPAPPHQPGLLPGWLAQYDVQVVIVSGIGQRAIDLFNEVNIIVHPGAPELPPDELVRAYLDDSLQTSANSCSNAGGDEHGGQCGGH